MQTGARLNGANQYTVTFGVSDLPPVRGFWSLTLYNEHHFFAPNDLKRYSIGTKNRALKYGADGSLTIYVQAESPGAGQGGKLAAGAEGRRFLAVCAHVLARRSHRPRQVDAAAGRQSAAIERQPD